ncbi:MAG: DNA damage-inducible protein D [Candidatus Margulisiibacteriota bacterium]
MPIVKPKKNINYSLDDINESVFEKIKQANKDGQEYWSARDMQQILGYSAWDKFKRVINKAISACENSGFEKDDHFSQMGKLVDIGSQTTRKIEDYQLSRYAAYLTIQNSDSSKEIVALGQTYFAVQTRKQEIIEQAEYQALETEDEKRLFLRNELVTHNKKLADAAKGAGVIRPIDYAIFQDHGYMGLYGGLKHKDIHERKGLKKSQKILDHMGSTELAANLFRATQTEDKLKRDNIKGKHNANKTHREVGEKVRQTIKDIGGTMPEDLPTADSIKKLENKQQKKLKAE